MCACACACACVCIYVCMYQQGAKEGEMILFDGGGLSFDVVRRSILDLKIKGDLVEGGT